MPKRRSGAAALENKISLAWAFSPMLPFDTNCHFLTLLLYFQVLEVFLSPVFHLARCEVSAPASPPRPGRPLPSQTRSGPPVRSFPQRVKHVTFTAAGSKEKSP